MKHFFKFLTLVLFAMLVTNCDNNDLKLDDDQNSQDPTTYVSIEAVMDLLKDSQLKESLSNLRKFSPKSKGIGSDNDTYDKYFEKLSFEAYDNYTLLINEYSEFFPYRLYLTVTIDNAGNENALYTRFIPNNPEDQFNVWKFNGQMDIEDINHNLISSNIMSSGMVMQVISTEECTTTTFISEIPCSNGDGHGVGQTCNPPFVNDAHFQISSVTECHNVYTYVYTVGGGGGGGGGGGSVSAQSIFENNLTSVQKSFLDKPNHSKFKTAILKYLEKNGYATGSSFCFWSINFMIDNPNITDEQFINWYLENEGGWDGSANPSYWDNPHTPVQQEELPKWNVFVDNYPADANGEPVNNHKAYEMAGGPLYQNHLSQPNTYNNACAVRVCYALNKCGILIPNIVGQTELGADGLYYFTSAYNLWRWMCEKFGTPTGDNIIMNQGANTSAGWKNGIASKKGIYIMRPNYPGQAGYTGHADMLHNGTCFNGCALNPSGGIYAIYIWPLTN